MLNIVLFEPEIPANTGNVVRTCSVTGCHLHLVKPLGFEIDDKHLKRAGLDYWSSVDITIYENIADFFDKNKNGVFFFASSKAPAAYHEVSYSENCYLIFGKETKGIPENILSEHYDECIRIPMINNARCLNLSNAVSIITYEALRQLNFKGFKLSGKMLDE